MNIFKRIFTPAKEERDTCPSWEALSGLNTGTGHLVNSRIAENLSTVLACVQAISTAMASLPATVYRLDGKTRLAAPEHPLSALIANGPNDKQTWPDFVEFMEASVLLRGNALAEIITDRAGRIVALKPIPWEWVSVQMLPTGRLVYDVTEIQSVYGGTGKMRRLLEGEVMHLRDRTDDTILGKSRIQRAGSVIRAGLSVQEFSESMYRNGANPSGALESDAKISSEGFQRLRQQFDDAYTGAQNARKVMLLDQGLHWKQISVSPEDAELLASRRFTTEELARIFQVPPPLVGIWDHSSFTNSETAGKWFASYTIGPWCRKFEAEIARSVLSASDRGAYQLEFDLSGFLRGDHGARWQGHEIAVRNGILTPNEIRLIEGWNPMPGGDELTRQKEVKPSA
jgi:HK97 family phage portal protein